MALFGKADDSLPVLTRFRQVEPFSANQLMSFFVNGTPCEMGEFLQRDIQTGEPTVENDTDHITAGLAVEFSTFHEILTRFLDALADDGNIDTTDGLALEWLLNMDNTRYTALMAGGDYSREDLRDWNAAGMYPANKIGLSIRNPPLYSPTKVRIQEELRQLLKPGQGRKVARCAECNYPFVIQRRGQGLCSHRCRTRKSARKMYRERQSLLKKDISAVQ